MGIDYGVELSISPGHEARRSDRRVPEPQRRELFDPLWIILPDPTEARDPYLVTTTLATHLRGPLSMRGYAEVQIMRVAIGCRND